MKIVVINLRRIAIVLFIFYILFVLAVSLMLEIKIFFPEGWMLLQKEPLMDVEHNIIPFNTILTYFSNSHKYNLDIILMNTLGNVVLFIPFGVLYTIISTRYGNWSSTLMLVILFSFMIEVLQYITRFGVFDIDDVILHAIGGLLGYGLVMIVHKTR